MDCGLDLCWGLDRECCRQRGSRPCLHAFGTRLSTVCVFGWEKPHLEMTVAFQVHNGPISADAKSDICQSDIMARKGTHARWPLITGHISFLSTLEVECTWVLAETSLRGCWCRKAWIENPHVTAGPCQPHQSKPGLDSVPNRSHLCGHRKQEPRWRPTQIFKDQKCQ